MTTSPTNASRPTSRKIGFLVITGLMVSALSLGACKGGSNDAIDTEPVDQTVVTDTPPPNVAVANDSLKNVMKNTGVDETLGICVMQTLVEKFGAEKADKISMLPNTDTSDDRVAMDQAVSDCRG